MNVRTVTFQGIPYQVRVLDGAGIYDGLEGEILVGPNSLEDVLMESDTEEADEIDDGIFFYLPDEEISKLTDVEMKEILHKEMV